MPHTQDMNADRSTEAPSAVAGASRMCWDKLLKRCNWDGKKPAYDKGRLLFQKDGDKLIYSEPFRRLMGKTQVHPFPDNDHIHNRLIHSMEVSCVGRTLGMRIGHVLRDKGDLPQGYTPDDVAAIVHAACLAHDIGNPPFGHAGEFAIRQWFASTFRSDRKAHWVHDISDAEMMDFTSFDGNAQGFRVVNKLEYNFDQGGMRLSFPTVASMVKYPWGSGEQLAKRGNIYKYGIYQDDLPLFKHVADEIGLLEIVPGRRWARHPLSYLMEAADDICYALLDIEDGIEIGKIAFDEFARVVQQYHPDQYHAAMKSMEKGSNRYKLARIRGSIIDEVIEDVIRTFVRHYDAIMCGQYAGDLINNCPERTKGLINKLKAMAYKDVFVSHGKVKIEIGAYNSIGIVLETFCEAVSEVIRYGHDDDKLSYRSIRVMDILEDKRSGYARFQDDFSPYQYYLSIVDYVAGMTDRYLTSIAADISGTYVPGR